MFRRLIGPMVAVVATALLPTAADAQTPDRRWQVELLGGLSLFELPTSGDAALPVAGPSLPTSGPTNPSRRVPTWFLGDGASLINGANDEFGVAARLVPLDSALGRLGLSGTNAPVMGLRLRRDLTTRWSLDLSTEVWMGATEIDPALLDAVETSRASFDTAFRGLFATGPFGSVNVDADVSVGERTSRELAVIGSVRYHLLTGSWSPYLTIGGGVLTRIGSLPSITLNGSYRFQVQAAAPTVSFAESDTVTLRFEQATGPVGVTGLGLRQHLSPRLGFSIDGRLYVSRETLSLRVDSAPTVTTGTPAGFIESFTTPAVQFSNNASTGRASSLSGTPLNGFKAFTTSGVQMRYAVTAGVFIRF
jgi:hypothetical protein